MHFSKIFAIAALFASGALAAPAPAAEAEANYKPAPRPQPTIVSQSNSCGNGAMPYCCNTDNMGAYTTCSVMGSGSVCSQTTVCCNANNSVQVCLGNANILL
ncbi:hypothetical protein LTR66_010870 [Elasticomyces elasticus]|nr:hypothetical protein LTR66_010870 [Elasticomyces elasticus]